MALNIGWKRSEQWESYWIEDPAFVDVSEAARQEWEESGDGGPLRPFVKDGAKPTRILFRSLTPDEARMVIAILHEAPSPVEGLIRAYLLCFRIAVAFPDLGGTIGDAGGAQHPTVVKERGTRMLATELVAHLEAAYAGIVTFYGAKVYAASFPSAAEKKASSPQSMPTRSASDTVQDEAAGATSA